MKDFSEDSLICRRQFLARRKKHEIGIQFDGTCMASSSCVNPSLTYMPLTARPCDFAVSEMKKNNL